MLKEDEKKYLDDNSIKECQKCGHLAIFHNYHCCSFCNVPECKCEYDTDTVDRKDATIPQ